MSDKECLMWVIIVLIITGGVTVSVIGICECIADCICRAKEVKEVKEVKESNDE